MQNLHTCNGILHSAWKLGQELTILSVSVDIKFVISPIENDLDKTVDVTLNVFLSIVDIIAPRIFSPIIDISQLKCTLNRAPTTADVKRPAAYAYLKSNLII